MIDFNKPYLTGDEMGFIDTAVGLNHLSGNGFFTKKCQLFFEANPYWGGAFGKCLLTTSCTDALEMAALLLQIEAGDEVILPSYTFVSTANAFVLRGAVLRFADTEPDFPNISVASIAELITSRTKAIVVVHYAGVTCAMDKIMDLANAHNIKVVEDAAQSIDAQFQGKWAGSMGHLAAFSFHETKNIHCGEGGMLVVNDPELANRAEILWEKGTNRSAFFRGEIDKYTWQDVGSSFLPSELNAAFLYAQLTNLEKIQAKRMENWCFYHQKLQLHTGGGRFWLPNYPNLGENETRHNGHIFAICANNLDERTAMIAHLKKSGVHAIFHYVSLHQTPFVARHFPDQFSRNLPNTARFSDTLIRLPLFVELTEPEIDKVVGAVLAF